MSDIARPTDLRERMRRVATKPRPRPGAASRGASVRRAGRLRRPAAGVPAVATETAPPRQAARVLTLLQWGRWELIEVPRRRIQWLATLVFGRR